LSGAPAAKAQYVVGEPIEIVGVLKNASDQAVLFTNNVPSLFVMDVRLPMPSWIPFKPKAQPSHRGARNKANPTT
jgi:hypothetical protein